MQALLLAVVTPLFQAAAPPPSAAPADYLQFETIRTRIAVQADGRQEATVEIAVLLRTAQAVGEFGQIAIPYVQGLGEVSFDEVVVRKPDGRQVPLEGLVPEELNPFGSSGLPIAADVRIRKVTLPGLEPGDRLSYRIVLRQRPLAPGRIFGESKFMPLASDPLQVFELDLPRAVPVQVELREGLPATWDEVPGPPDRLVRRLSLRVPRPQGDGNGMSEDEQTAWTSPDVIFTNFRSWPDVGQWWWTLSQERLAPDAAVRAEAATIVGDRKTPREKIEAIHAFVASRIRYLSVGFGIGRMQPRGAGEVLASRYGDCKDKHALLQALASAAGVEVRPVLVNSVRKELRGAVPSPQQFDHMISVARLGADPSQWLWMDSTNALGVAGYLSPNLRDKRALMIAPGGAADLVQTPADPPFTPRTEIDTKGTLDGAGVLRAHVTWTFRTDAEAAWRSLFASSSPERNLEGVKGTLARSWKDATVSNVSFSDPADVSTPFRVEFDVERTVSGRSANKEWTLWLPLPEYDLPEPDEKPAEGKAVRFAVREFAVRAVIELPEGASARSPLSVTLERPFGTFRSTYAAEGRRLRVERTLSLARGHVGVDEVPAYESFRKALDADRDQTFAVGPVAAAAGSAETLFADGKAAATAKDYARAAELLRQAAEKDPKLDDVWNELGRALRDKGDHEGALAAFGKQIDVDPFDEVAYAERAYVLLGRNQLEEAEKALLKQVEVAPFKAWSYGKLGDLRTRQKRFSDAADYYGRAATIEPKDAEHVLHLAWAHAWAGRPQDARAAAARAAALDLADWQQVNLARVSALLGDEADAASPATAAEASIRGRLARLGPNDVSARDHYWTLRLAEAWHVLGAAALAKGDLAAAERYLSAAWRSAFLPEAAWALGRLREKQQRAAEAARFRSAAVTIAGAEWRLPAGHEKVAASARKHTPERPEQWVMDSRIHALAAPPIEDVTAEVLMLVGADGVVEKVKTTGSPPAAAARQLARLGKIRLPLALPGETPAKIVLSGLLSCNKLTNCSVVLDLPGMQSMTGMSQ